MQHETIGDCKLYLADCMNVLPTLPKIDLLLIDPPYGIDIGGRGSIGGRGIYEAKNYGKSDWDKNGLSEQQWALLRIIADKWIVWGGNHLADVLGPSAGILIWDKKCQNGWDDTFSDCEIAWTNILTRAKAFRHRWIGAFRDSERGANIRQHPTQKPVVLLEWCLSFAPQAETVLDCYMGSGTTGVACAKLGRKFIGIEINEEYFKIACERIQKAYDQPDLFIEPPKKAEQIGLL